MYFECLGISLCEAYRCSECYSVVHNALALFSYAAGHYVLNAPEVLPKVRIHVSFWLGFFLVSFCPFCPVLPVHAL